MATVILPRSLLVILPAADRRVEVDASTVSAAIDALEIHVPGIRNRLCDAGPTIRQHINIFVNGERADLATPIPEGATVHVIPAVSGG